MSTLSFDGDVIVVTGAGGGMGRCHALELAGRGARVVVNDLGGHPFGGGSDPGLAETVVQEIRAAGGEAALNTESVATSEGAASLTEQAMDEWGRLDAVVANAAILRDKPFDEMTIDDFDAVIDVNLRGVMRVLHPPDRRRVSVQSPRPSAAGRVDLYRSTTSSRSSNMAKSPMLRVTSARS